MKALKSLLKNVRESISYVNFNGTHAWITDYAVEMEVQVGEGEPSTPVALPRQVLLDLLEAADVNLFLKDNQVVASGPGFLAQIRTGEGTPPIILSKAEEPISRVNGDFVKAVRNALSVGRKNTAYEAKVLVEVGVEGDGVKVVATDGYRLHIYTLEAEVYREAKLYLPTTADEPLKILNRSESLTLYRAWEGNALVVESPAARVGFNLATPRYPSYQNAIPSQPPEGHIRTSRKDLIQALKRALVVAERDNHAVRLTASQNGLRVEAMDDSSSPISEEILPGEGQGRSFIDGNYLVDALEEIGGNEVNIALYSGAQVPLVEVKDEKFYALIAGLRVTEDSRGEG
jgi:DNA polymerase-3 subunit beta